MRNRSIAAGLGCAFLCVAAHAGLGVWSGQGPYGGYVFDILQDPTSTTTLYISTRSGIFKSTDSGDTWAPAMNGIVGSVSYGFPLVIDAEASALYSADSTGHLYRSTDGAANWMQTGYLLPPVAGIPQINQITDAPASTTRVYLATVPSGILVSNDDGATFTAINGSGTTALPASVPFQTIAVDPANANNLLAGTAFDDLGPGPDVPSIYRSSDGGATWTGVLTIPQGGETYYPTVSEISFGIGAEVYANVDQQIFRSPDGGATWSAAPTSTLNVEGYVTTIKADASTANSLFAGGYFGLMHSSDGGTTFGNVAAVATELSPNGVDIATASRLLRSGSNWFLATQEAGLFKSTNSGVNWSPSNTGIEATNIRALGMVPITASPPRILAGYGDAFRPSPGMYGGSDAGDGNMTWANSNTTLRAYQIRTIAVDPTTASGTPGTTIVYAGGRSEQSAAFAPRNGGLYKSSDGGSTWSTIDSGLPQRVGSVSTPFLGTVRSMVLDPQSCAGYPACSSALNTVYATSNGCFLYSAVVPSSGGNVANIGKCGSPFSTQYTGSYQFRILKSIDGGANWANSDSGIPQSFPGTPPNVSDYESLIVIPLVIDPINPNILYAGTADSYDPTYVTSPTLQTGIFKSTDNGATWNPVNTGLPTHATSETILDVPALAIDPNTPTTLWAAVIDFSTGAPGHIYKTIDGGAHWSDSSVGLTSADIRALLVDPANPNVLYAAGGGTSGNPGGVFKSYDGGATWHSISVALPADAGLALALDPGNHDKLYAGTSSGVWEMTQTLDSDLDGVSDAQEDLGPNNGDSNLDTIKDKIQADVTYVPPHQSAAAPMHGKAPSAPSSNDFAVQVITQGSTCVQAQDVQSKPSIANGPDPIAANLDYVYSLDLIQFEILNCAGTTVKVTYPNFTFGPGWTFRFYGPLNPESNADATIKWYDFSSNATKLDAHTWQLTLTRGNFGSYRPTSTGAILFQGGPAYSDRVFGNGFN